MTASAGAVASLLAAVLAASPAPATLLLEELARTQFRIEVLGRADRELTAAERCRLNAGPITAGQHRTGLLCTASGMVAAETSLVILPGRVPRHALAALAGTDVPAGKILAPLGVQRLDRHARCLAWLPGHRRRGRRGPVFRGARPRRRQGGHRRRADHRGPVPPDRRQLRGSGVGVMPVRVLIARAGTEFRRDSVAISGTDMPRSLYGPREYHVAVSYRRALPMERATSDTPVGLAKGVATVARVARVARQGLPAREQFGPLDSRSCIVTAGTLDMEPPSGTIRRAAPLAPGLRTRCTLLDVHTVRSPPSSIRFSEVGQGLRIGLKLIGRRRLAGDDSACDGGRAGFPGRPAARRRSPGARNEPPSAADPAAYGRAGLVLR